MGKESNIFKYIITVMLVLLILGLEDGTTSAVPIEQVCDYAAPPPGCSYVNGPDYNSTTRCGMVLTCPTPIPTPPAGVTLDSNNVTMPTSTVPIQHICDYAAPPPGCKYINGPNFNSTTLCGMVLSCSTPISTPPEPKNILPGLDFSLGISILSVAYLFGKKRR